MIGLVRSLAAELAGRGVRVNAVAPGPTDTPLLAADSPWRSPDYLATLPNRRLTRPDEIARIVAFLLERRRRILHRRDRLTQRRGGDLMDDQPLRGRLALVTGAAQGIGAAIAAPAGRRRRRRGRQRSAGRVRRWPRWSPPTGGFPAVGDMSDPAIARSRRRHRAGPSARRRPGVQRGLHDHGPPLSPTSACARSSWTTDEDEWWKVIDTNLAGTFGLIQAVLPGMRRAGGGNIVVIASEWGVIGWPGASAYSASKAGLIALVEDAWSRAGPGEHHRQRRRAGGGGHPAARGRRRRRLGRPGRDAASLRCRHPDGKNRTSRGNRQRGGASRT